MQVSVSGWWFPASEHCGSPVLEGTVVQHHTWMHTAHCTSQVYYCTPTWPHAWARSVTGMHLCSHTALSELHSYITDVVPIPCTALGGGGGFGDLLAAALLRALISEGLCGHLRV